MPLWQIVGMGRFWSRAINKMFSDLVAQLAAALIFHGQTRGFNCQRLEWVKSFMGIPIFWKKSHGHLSFPFPQVRGPALQQRCDRQPPLWLLLSLPTADAQRGALAEGRARSADGAVLSLCPGARERFLGDVKGGSWLVEKITGMIFSVSLPRSYFSLSFN